MPEIRRGYVGVKDVTWTPDGGSAIAIPLMDNNGVEHAETTRDIRHKDADGQYHTFVTTTGVQHEVTVRSSDLSVIGGTDFAVNTYGVLSWTLVGAGLAAGSDLVVTSDAKIVKPTEYPGTGGDEPSVGAVTFLLLSSDGTTDPLAVT